MQHEWHEVKERPWYLAWLNFFIAPDSSKGSSSISATNISLDGALDIITPKLSSFTADAVKDLLSDVVTLRKNVVVLGKNSLTEKCWAAVRYVFRCGPSDKVVGLADTEKKLAALAEGLCQRQLQLIEARVDKLEKRLI